MELFALIMAIAIGSIIYFARLGRQHTASEERDAKLDKEFEQGLLSEYENNVQRLLGGYRTGSIGAIRISDWVKAGTDQAWNDVTNTFLNRTIIEPAELDEDKLSQLKTRKAILIMDFVKTRIAQVQKLIDEGYPVPAPVCIKNVPKPEFPPTFQDDPRFREFVVKFTSMKRRNELVDEVTALSEKLANAYQVAESHYQISNKKIMDHLESAVKTWESDRLKWQKDAKNEFERLISIQRTFIEDDNVSAQAMTIIKSGIYPSWLPNSIDAKYSADQKILIIEMEFPNIENIKLVKKSYLKSGITLKELPKRDQKQRGEEFYPLLTLRVAIDLAHNLNLAHVELLVVNGWINHRNRATGKYARAFCASLGAKPKDLLEIDLEHCDVVAAFFALKGNASRTLDVTPIAPVSRISVDDPRFVDDKSVIDSLKQEENLAVMAWEDFEHLCRELFERLFAREGAVVKVTQASRDQGVDAVIVDPRPIYGGKTVVQAKRYTNTVDVSAVRDLYGTVNHEGANKGILVTTSHFGPDAYAFIQGKNLELINGSELLYILSEHGYNFRIDIAEAKRMQRSD